ncbi:uncharacterized protein IWZ02DRAFT_494919 [Phyllosticta citriasiana]|uniref:NYN domain-containing protein n=1 Tax=Phyllosticta citriasiana TaxID=595635 RepID=A0ABR1KIS4_9PEZI
MPSTPDQRPWDFSQALNLINSLSPALGPGRPASQITPPQQPLHDVEVADDKINEASCLGDFNKVWAFLQTPNKAPLPAATVTPPDSDHTGSETLVEKEKHEYASDGATYGLPLKETTWKDQDPIDDLADESDAYQETGPAAAANTQLDPTLTKTQRKRENRKARKRAEAEKRSDKTKASSEVESADGARAKNTPARKASVHTIEQSEHGSKATASRYNLRSLGAPKTPQPKKTVQDVAFHAAAPYSAPKMMPTSLCPSTFQPKSIDVSANSSKKLEDSAIPFNLGANRSPKKSKSKSKREFSNSASPTKHADLTYQPSTSAGLDSGYYNALLNNTPIFLGNSVSPGPATSPQHTGTFTVRDKDDRNLHFFLTLVQHFPEDKHWLAKPAQLVNHTESPNGIHVFIDFSNIHIGFQNRVKSMRGLPVNARIRREDIDFDAFVLLMERRRPVTKRVLVGSLPAIPAFEKAKAIGYETNILDKVYKARELTNRQKYFRQRDAEQLQQYRRRNGGTTTSGEGSGSGSETGNAASSATHAKTAWVEQGVDEILHLKMLESVVDVDEPSTIVLATGDAAAAEYSQGFMRMVERALKRGWRVELVSWKAGISSQYMKRDFRQKWGDRFRIVELDDWVEDLLDT